jgi:hypothetical protein
MNNLKVKLQEINTVDSNIKNNETVPIKEENDEKEDDEKEDEKENDVKKQTGGYFKEALRINELHDDLSKIFKKSITSKYQNKYDILTKTNNISNDEFYTTTIFKNSSETPETQGVINDIQRGALKLYNYLSLF